MCYQNNPHQYRTATNASIDEPSRKPEAQEPERNRLGGYAPVPALANSSVLVVVGRMSHTTLDLDERIEIETGLKAGWTQCRVALQLKRSAGTISTELKRNGGRTKYCAQVANLAARERKARVRRGHCAIEQMPPLRAAVHDYLRRGWSPEEIAGTLKREHPDLEHMQTSHESIYRYVYIVARGELKRELAKCLRRKHRTRKPLRRGVVATQGKIPNMVLVDERPPEVEDRLIAGHYEADLILGAGNRSAVGVIVERTSRFTMLCHLPAKDATSVREAFTRRLRSIPLPLRKTLTYDQGKEMAQHQILAADLQLKIFFCHPHSPWERATCESQNDRIRHYLPKGSDLSKVSYQQLSAYQEMLNERPRKILNWKSPALCFQQLISAHQSSN